MHEGAISTGSLRLDIALGIGGVPRGEFIEISGDLSSGKTTLCQHIVAEAQKTEGTCAWIDADHSLDPIYAAQCGVNAGFLYVAEPEDAEQALQIVETLAGSGSMAVIILDSIASMTSQEELKRNLGEGFGLDNDRLLSQTLRRLYKVIHRNRTSIIFTNLAQTGISMVYHNLAQNPTRLALKLQAGLRLELHKLHIIQTKGNIIGNRTWVRIVKNQFAPCIHRIEFDIINNKGIHKAGEILDLGIQLRIIGKLRTEYFFKGQNLGEKRVEALKFLDQNLPIAEEIEKIIRQKLLPYNHPAAT